MKDFQYFHIIGLIFIVWANVSSVVLLKLFILYPMGIFCAIYSMVLLVRETNK